MQIIRNAFMVRSSRSWLVGQDEAYEASGSSHTRNALPVCPVLVPVPRGRPNAWRGTCRARRLASVRPTDRGDLRCATVESGGPPATDPHPQVRRGRAAARSDPWHRASPPRRLVKGRYIADPPPTAGPPRPGEGATSRIEGSQRPAASARAARAPRRPTGGAPAGASMRSTRSAADMRAAARQGDHRDGQRSDPAGSARTVLTRVNRRTAATCGHA